VRGRAARADYIAEMAGHHCVKPGRTWESRAASRVESKRESQFYRFV
jgi:hypothetical protein